MRNLPLITLSAVCGSAVLASGPAFANSPLAAHRAVYEIELDQASERSGIKGMEGRMVYAFGGSECDGYTSNFRFVTRIETEDASRLTDQQTTTFEDVEDKMFQFSTRSFVDAQQDRDVKGVAESSDEGATVTLSKPEERDIDLPEAAFPTQHVIEILEAAKEGERIYERRIFDGSEEADRALSAATVIAGAKVHGEDGASAGDLPDTFKGMTYWPVTTAYYTEGEEDAGEALPIYSMQMNLFENGVAGDIAMDYGEFQLNGTLSEIEMQASDTCE